MKNKKAFFISLILIIIALIALILFLVLNYSGDMKQTVSYIKTSTTNDDESVDNPIDFKSLQKENPDIYAWIKVPGTEIDYAVLQSSVSDDYYLHRDESGNFKFAGSIYSQALNSKDFSDPVTVLYGHNMLNGSMFASLHKFKDADFFEENKEIIIYTPNRILTYTIFSAFRSDNNHILNTYDFNDLEVLQNYIDSVTNPKSTIKNTRNNVEVTTNDKIIVLSTCTSNSNYRYLVEGVLTNDQPTK